MVSTSALRAAPANSGAPASAVVGRGGRAPTLTAGAALAFGGSVTPNHGPSFFVGAARRVLRPGPTQAPPTSRAGFLPQSALLMSRILLAFAAPGGFSGASPTFAASTPGTALPVPGSRRPRSRLLVPASRFPLPRSRFPDRVPPMTTTPRSPPDALGRAGTGSCDLHHQGRTRAGPEGANREERRRSADQGEQRAGRQGFGRAAAPRQA